MHSSIRVRVGPDAPKKMAVAYLNGGAFPGSCLRLKRHCPARGPACHDMVQLPELAIAQHAQVELVVFGRTARERTLLDSGNEPGGRICVVQLVDQVAL